MQFVVEKENFNESILVIDKYRYAAVDTETTGLRPYHADKLFSVQVAVPGHEFYFDFTKTHTLADLGELMKTVNCMDYVFMQNAKFDMAFLDKAGAPCTTKVYDTEVLGRICFNDHLRYNLDAQADRILGEQKDDRVKKYLEENELYEIEVLPGKKGTNKKYFFDRVPLAIIAPYAMRDAELTLRLGETYLKELKALEDAPLNPSKVLENEAKITRVCYDMEKLGIKVNRSYCEEATKFYTDKYKEAEGRFAVLAKQDLVDSGKALQEVFEREGIVLGQTEKGNPEITDFVLRKIDHPLSVAVRDYRDGYKLANTYFSSFSYYADSNDIIHPNMRQAGTKTGRFSYWDPNLQNVPAVNLTDPYPVRRAFIPRDGYYFLMVDYEQMEFKLMLEYAEQMDLIYKIRDGLDAHQATSDVIKEQIGIDIPRKTAKAINFGKLYGMGLDKLSLDLGVTREQAKQFNDQYFKALPHVKQLIYSATNIARSRGYVSNWMGRRYYFQDPNFAYRAINAIIQGGCADIVKKAMTRLPEVLKDCGINMLLQIHDELLFEVPIGETKGIDDILSIMENTYPHKYLPLTCSTSYSYKSWGDAVEGRPGKKGDTV